MVCHSTCEDDEMEQWSWRASINKKSQKGMMEKKVSELCMYQPTYPLCIHTEVYKTSSKAAGVERKSPMQTPKPTTFLRSLFTSIHDSSR